MAARSARERPRHLIFDADDTLWENNIYFERAFDDFVAFLRHSTLDAGRIRAVLDEIEIANARVHGYGSLNFGRNLHQAYQRLAERDVRPQDRDIILQFAARILEQPVELIDGVDETLAHLAAHYELTLFTKGDAEEQRLKVARSGVAGYFSHTAIVKEKDRDSYRSLVDQRKFTPSQTWMIGNSPKSDINPALEAGLNAVLIPHAHTWTLERQEIREGPGQLIRLERFAELRGCF
ncbi:MAG: HAD family hydrolase [Bryobacteraceae bacterium]